jgi:ADP-ribosylglycohydrolase
MWLPPGVDLSETPLCGGIERVARGSFKTKQPPEIRGTGYVVDSLEAALWAFSESDSFREGCLKAANLGDDADTTAAIFGQLAGAYYGKSGIPDPWLQRLCQADRIEQLALRLPLSGSYQRTEQ